LHHRVEALERRLSAIEDVLGALAGRSLRLEHPASDASVAPEPVRVDAPIAAMPDTASLQPAGCSPQPPTSPMPSYSVPQPPSSSVFNPAKAVVVKDSMGATQSR